MNFGRNLALLIGRWLLAAIFLASGWGKIGGFEETVGLVSSKVLPIINLAAEDPNAPLIAKILVGLAIAVELGGGLMLLLGWRAKLGAFLLLLFLIPTTYFFHAFWLAEDPAVMKTDMISFLKNLGLMGGMIYVLICGAGGLALSRPKPAVVEAPSAAPTP